MQSRTPFLLKLVIKNFRNISELGIDLSPHLNLFVGQNGQGKTNCLHAIALACSLRPLQSLQNTDLIKHEQNRAELLAQFSDFSLSLEIGPQGKKANIDGKNIKSALTLMERIPIVSFIPEELLMITGAKSLRRRALDAVTGSLYFEHFASLKAYEKIVSHRNFVLKSWPLDQQTLKTFDQLLINEGALIMHQRLRALAALDDLFASSVKNILGPFYSGALSYAVNEAVIRNFSLADLKALIYEKSRQYHTAEMARKVTLFGPHLDDVLFLLNGHDAKNFASRGQMRAMVLAFKLAHMFAVQKIREHAPIVILDDIVSELDAVKKENLIDVVKNLDTQAFFSATDIEAFGSSSLDLKVYSLD